MKWDTDIEETRTIGMIADRALTLIENGSLPEYPRGDMSMDITATHLNGCPLDLDKLLTFKTQDFMHDIYGIRRHINRATGEMMAHFLPRCAKS